jgi:hypothetical protein
MSDKLDLDVFERALKSYVKPVDIGGGLKVFVSVVVEGDEVCVSVNDVPVIRVIGEPGPSCNCDYSALTRFSVSIEERVSKLEKKN